MDCCRENVHRCTLISKDVIHATYDVDTSDNEYSFA
jgi:hypothetical protein